jgi:replicative DNA helicase
LGTEHLSTADQRAGTAECSLVGALVLKPEMLEEVLDLVPADAFLMEDAKAVYCAMQRIRQKSSVLDAATLAMEVPGEKEFFTRCAETVPSLSPENIRQYALNVVEYGRERKLCTALLQAGADCCTGSSAAEVCQSLEKLLEEQRKLEQDACVQTLHTAQNAVVDWMLQFQSKQEEAQPTRFSKLDYLLGGLQKGSLYTLAARPGKGKTDLALAIAVNVCMKQPVLYISLEMPSNQLIERILSRLCRIESSKLHRKDLTKAERDNLSDTLEDFKNNAQFFIDDGSNYTVQTIQSRVRKVRPFLVVVDNLNLLQPEKAGRQQHEEIAENTAALKRMALSEQVAVLLLAQESRDADKGDGKPTMSNLRGSAAIESDSDVVAFVHPQESDDDKPLSGSDARLVELYIVKNRAGQLGEINYLWQPQFHKWMEATEDCDA